MSSVTSNEEVKVGHLQKIKFLYRDGIYLGDREEFKRIFEWQRWLTLLRTYEFWSTQRFGLWV